MFLRIKLFCCVAAVLATTATAQTTADLGTELRLVYRSQAPDGALRLEGLAAFYARYPVLATFALDECRRRPNAALASQSAAAVSRYYDFLFGTYDRDHDLLVETTVRDAGGHSVEVEDIGFNALLSMDMLSLAALHVDIRRPFRALYWYQGARLVQDAVVYAGFDPAANYFFPIAAAGGAPVKQYRALSILPLLFRGEVGDNHATTVIREYLLDPTARAPESPYAVLAGPAAEWVDDTVTSGHVLEALLMIEILESRGFTAEANTFRTQAVSAAINGLAGADGGPSAHHRHLVDLLEHGDAGAFRSHVLPLDLFAALIQTSDALEDEELVRLLSAVESAHRWLSVPPDQFTVGDATAADMAVRTIYRAVSSARQRLDDRSLFPSEAYRATGTDPNQAMRYVIDDVVATVREIDNRVFERRFARAGLHLTPTLLREKSVAGGAVEVKWTIGVHNEPLTLRRLSVTVGDNTAVLIDEDSPLTLVPGRSETLRSDWIIDRDRVGSLEAVTLTTSVDAGDALRGRAHFVRSTYVDHPVEVAAVFGSGRMLRGETLPIDIVIHKKTPEAASVRFEWFSPTGLHLVEGRTGEYAMPAEQDSATLALNVVVPSPCRPGRFPFKLKFYANGIDLGLVSSSLFKPYSWLFAGPFEAGRNPMATTYPPQKGIEILDTYRGARGTIRWRVVDDGIYQDGDVIEMRHLMGTAGVGFLHTVVETEFQTTMPVLLSSTAPAALYVNGEPVLTAGEARTGAVAGAPVYARADFASGENEILIKVAGDRSARLSFQLGDENSDASYTFNNDLEEILDGYATLVRRNSGHEDEPRESQKVVTLRYQNPAARSVAVIGTFNGWSPDRARMHALDDGTWEIVLTLPPGKHAYRFLVDGRDQVLDPDNDTVEPDGFGGKNSVIVVE